MKNLNTISKAVLKNMFAYLLILTVLLVFLFLQLPDGKFHIYFLDVGQGDSIFIVTPKNNQILIDGGSGNKVLSQLAEVMPFFDKSIDMLILTHPHEDHIAGLLEVLKRYKVDYVVFTGVYFHNHYYDEFLDILEEKEIQYFIAQADMDFAFGELLLDILYPFESVAGSSFSNINDSSIALKLVYGNNKVLLSGDLEAEAEDKLVKSGSDLRADMLKLGHHGSKSSSSMEFLNKVKAEIAVIQSGKGNSFGHPHDESLRNSYRAGIKEIRRNDEEGRVEFVFEP